MPCFVEGGWGGEVEVLPHTHMSMHESEGSALKPLSHMTKGGRIQPQMGYFPLCASGYNNKLRFATSGNV